MKINFEDLIGLVDCATKGAIELVIGGFVDYDEVTKMKPGFHPESDHENFGYTYCPDNGWMEIFHKDMTGHVDRHAMVDLTKKEYLRIKIAVIDEELKED